MWMRKLSLGVLRVLTPMGPRYIKPETFQRLHLLWIFRNFEVLPLQVLSLRQQKLIDMLCSEHRFASLPPTAELEDAPILGTVEWRPHPDAPLPPSRPSSSVTRVAGLANEARQRP